MARSKSKTSKHSSPIGRWCRKLLLPGLAIAAFVSGVLLAVNWIADGLAQHLRTAPENQLPIARVAITPLPDWIAVDVAAQAFADAGFAGPTIPLADPDLVPKLARAFSASVWVQRVERIERGHQRLEIQLAYRQPVLGLARGDQYCYVDATGMVLPSRQASARWLRQCLLLEGIRGGELPAVGQRFSDPRIAIAGALAAQLLPVKQELDLVVIEIRSASGQPFRCDLKTRQRGSRIVWGAMETEVDSLPTSVKIDRLLAYRQQYGSLDSPDGPYLFDVVTMDDARPAQLGMAK